MMTVYSCPYCGKKVVNYDFRRGNYVEATTRKVKGITKLLYAHMTCFEKTLRKNRRVTDG